MISKANLVAAAFVLILFALPFTAVSCNGHVVAQASGYQIAVGTDSNEILTADGRGIVPSEYQSTSQPGSWPAQAALLFVVLGGLVGLSNLGVRKIVAALFFGTAAALLVYLQSALQSRHVEDVGTSLFDLQFLPSYWAALILCALAALVNLIAIATPLDGQVRIEPRAGPPAS